MRESQTTMDLHLRQIVAGKGYEQLSVKLQKALSRSEYNSRAKQYYIAKQALWNEVPMLETVCAEADYYTELVSVLKAQERLYPYHIATYISRVQRISAYRYYSDILVAALKAERAYDSIPNFTAADIVRVVGIGRNEFIDILNKCRGKFMWKLSKSAAKDLLPSEPRAIDLRPWWVVGAVAVTNDEMRRSKKKEVEVVDRLLSAGVSLEVAELGEPEAITALYKRGLVYIDVPILPDDRISIPPLENFVSNRSNRDDDSIEGVLYSVFVASSERATVGELAKVLEVDLDRVLRAVSLGCRLGFAERIGTRGLRRAPSVPSSSRRTSLGLDSGADAMGLGDAASTGTGTPGDVARSEDGGDTAYSDAQDVDGEEEEEEEETSRRSFAAILVDTTLTSFLMMGNLSAGLKRHAVTLFEGGKLSDTNVMEFNNELRSVESTDATFEGTVEEIVEHVQSLGVMLEGVCSLRQTQARLSSLQPLGLKGSNSSKKEEEEVVVEENTPINLIDVGDVSSLSSPTSLSSPPPARSAAAPDAHDRDLLSSSSYADTPCEGTQSPSTPRSPRANSLSVVTPIVVGGIDVVRVESMSTLPRDVCRRVLERDYSLIIETTPLRAYPLPLLPPECSTTVVGMPGIELQLPWSKIAMHVFSGAGPESLVIPAGTRLRELPHSLCGVPFVALWPWSCQNGPSSPRVVETASLLATLDASLSSHATMVQKMPRRAIDASGRHPSIMTASIPLPVCKNDKGRIVAFMNGSWEAIEISLPSDARSEEGCIARLIRDLGLNNTIGVLEVACSGARDGLWLPHDLFFGIPLYHTKLCKIVMNRALDGGLFSVEGLARHKETVAKIRAEVRGLIRAYALPSSAGEGGDGEPDVVWDEFAESAQPREAIFVSKGTVSTYSLSAFVQGGLTIHDVLLSSQAAAFPAPLCEEGQERHRHDGDAMAMIADAAPSEDTYSRIGSTAATTAIATDVATAQEESLI